jgi:alpha-L-rhamnosidase
MWKQRRNQRVAFINRNNINVNGITIGNGLGNLNERLNSMIAQDGFGGNNHMNSFNHYAFGSVTNWLLQRSIGIAQNLSSPRFKLYVHSQIPHTS